MVRAWLAHLIGVGGPTPRRGEGGHAHMATVVMVPTRRKDMDLVITSIEDMDLVVRSKTRKSYAPQKILA